MSKAIPVNQLPSITQTQFWTYTARAREEFLAKTHPFESAINEQIETHKFKKITLEALLEYMRQEEASFLHEVQPSILRNALDLSQSFASIGNDTKQLRMKILTSFNRLKAIPSGITTVQQLYDSWVSDYKSREVNWFVRKEQSFLETYLAREKNPAADTPAGLLQELQWCDEEGAFLKQVLSRLKELSDWDFQGKFPKVWERTSIRVDQLPRIDHTEFMQFSPAAIQKFMDITRPFQTKLDHDLEHYSVSHLRKSEYVSWLHKQSVFENARPDILSNAKDLSKPYGSLGIDTAKLRTWINTGLKRLLESTNEENLSVIFKQWAADVRSREQIHFVRSELSAIEHHLKDQSGNENFRKELDWCKEEGDFLAAVVTRLQEIRNLNEPLVQKDKAEQERARIEEEKKIAAAKKQADLEAKKKEEEAKKAAEIAAKAAAEEEKKKKAAEDAKKQEDAKNAVAASVGAVQNKMQMYQAELQQLQQKMAKGEITGADFGAAVGALSKKYFS